MNSKSSVPLLLRVARLGALAMALPILGFAADPPPAAATPAKPAAEPATIRIIAGTIDPVKDEAGQVWKPSTGFEDGQTKERSGLEIANTKIPSIYQAERFGMTKFVQKLPNRKYTVKLHFAVTYEGITGAGQCVFSMDVEGGKLKNFDVWEKAGGGLRAHVESVPVTVTDGQLDIQFSGEGESSTISAIEIVPAT